MDAGVLEVREVVVFVSGPAEMHSDSRIPLPVYVRDAKGVMEAGLRLMAALDGLGHGYEDFVVKFKHPSGQYFPNRPAAERYLAATP